MPSNSEETATTAAFVLILLAGGDAPSSPVCFFFSFSLFIKSSQQWLLPADGLCNPVQQEEIMLPVWSSWIRQIFSNLSDAAVHDRKTRYNQRWQKYPVFFFTGAEVKY